KGCTGPSQGASLSCSTNYATIALDPSHAVQPSGDSSPSTWSVAARDVTSIEARTPFANTITRRAPAGRVADPQRADQHHQPELRRPRPAHGPAGPGGGRPAADGTLNRGRRTRVILAFDPARAPRSVFFDREDARMADRLKIYTDQNWETDVLASSEPVLV